MHLKMKTKTTMMKTALISSLLLAAAALPAAAQDGGSDGTAGGARYANVRLERQGDFLGVGIDFDLSELKVERNRAVLLTPRLARGGDTLELPAVAVYGRKRYFYYRRNAGDGMISGMEETGFLASERPDTVAYSRLVPYADWMDGARLQLARTDYGCCGAPDSLAPVDLGRYRGDFFPLLVYVKPEADAVKADTLEGSSFVDFPVDQTIIYPDYRNNTRELAVIRATIDTVRNDPDVTLDSVWLKGWASPESPYSHNTDLAIGRTRALKQYIQRMYNFTSVKILTDYEPENWIGLKRFVEASNLEHRDEILAMIDLDMDPDAKEAKIKRTYPDEYRFMLTEYYPALRRTDYRVFYHVRKFTDPAEILRMMRVHPQKLSLDEFYLAASTLEPGTEEFTEAYETAVRMFPGDPVANLNAANAAMRRGDNQAAERYLAKAGNSPEAAYARGALAIREGDYARARRYMEQARDAGLRQAQETLEEMDEREMK